MIGKTVILLALISGNYMSSEALLRAKRPTIPRIVGGQTLQRNEFPWMVSLQYKGQHFCGATMINEWWAVTAAHCVDKNMDLEVVCGEYCLSKVESNEQRIGVKTIVAHEKWNSSLISDDIAIIGLKEKIQRSASCQTIDLPSDGLQLPIALECVATGWGLKSSQEQSVSDWPQKVVLPIISQKDCQKSYTQQTKIFKTNVCAGGQKGKGICNGDSGGPLNCQLNGKWTFVGLDSFTVPCALKGFPSVFTRVQEYNSWIRKKINENKH